MQMCSSRNSKKRSDVFLSFYPSAETLKMCWRGLLCPDGGTGRVAIKLQPTNISRNCSRKFCAQTTYSLAKFCFSDLKDLKFLAKIQF